MLAKVRIRPKGMAADMAAAGCLAVAADTLCQKVIEERERIDWRRAGALAHTAAFGAAVVPHGSRKSSPHARARYRRPRRLQRPVRRRIPACALPVLLPRRLCGRDAHGGLQRAPLHGVSAARPGLRGRRQPPLRLAIHPCLLCVRRHDAGPDPRRGVARLSRSSPLSAPLPAAAPALTAPALTAPALPGKALALLQGEWWPTYTSCTAFWIPFMAANFRMVAPARRVQAMAVANMFWNVVIDYLAHRQLHAPPSPERPALLFRTEQPKTVVWPLC